jgi:hypothetical protein
MDRRIEYAFDIHERGTDRLICEASYRVACVDRSTFAPRAFPAEILTLLAKATCDPATTSDPSEALRGQGSLRGQSL